MRRRSPIQNHWLLLAVLSRDALSRAFWRLSAHLLAFALEYRAGLARALPYLPYTSAGLVAFFLGRMIASYALA